MNTVASDAERRIGEYRPAPELGGEKAAENGPALIAAIARGDRNVPIILDVGNIQTNRPGQYLSGWDYATNEPRYSGTRHSGGILGNRGLGAMQNRREYERRAQVAPSRVPGGLLGRQVPVGRVSSARLPGSTARSRSGLKPMHSTRWEREVRFGASRRGRAPIQTPTTAAPYETGTDTSAVRRLRRPGPRAVCSDRHRPTLQAAREASRPMPASASGLG
jgi:hypothetical protein